MYDDHFYCTDYFDNGCNLHSQFCWCFTEVDPEPGQNICTEHEREDA